MLDPSKGPPGRSQEQEHFDEAHPPAGRLRKPEARFVVP